MNKYFFKNIEIKNLYIFFIIIVLSAVSCNTNNKKENTENNNLNDSIKIEEKSTINKLNIVATDEIIELSQNWINKFYNKHKKYDINLIKKNDLKNIDKSHFIISNVYPDTISNYLQIKLAKDIIVFIFNNNNPNIQSLVFQGAKPQQLKNIFTGNITYWSQILDINKTNEPIITYRSKDNSNANKALRNYFKLSDDSKILGKALNNDNEILNAVSNNPLSIGIVSYNKAYSLDGKFKTQGIYILPIDFNSDKIIGDEEHIFDRKDILLNAFNRGDYPQELSKDINIYIPMSCEKTAYNEFVNWLLSEGQNYLEQYGLIPLSNTEIKVEKEKFN